MHRTIRGIGSLPSRARRRARLGASTASAALGLLAAGHPAATSSSRPPDRVPLAHSLVWIDANDVEMVVTNYGSFAWNIPTGNPGLVFPRGSGKTALFAAGLWIGATVRGESRIAAAEYSQDYVPGPMSGGTFLPDRPEFRVYSITRGDTTSPDYRSWPVDQGAPLDSAGRPALRGDQTLWAVYNDADARADTLRFSPGILGVQVAQTTYASAGRGALDNTVFLRFRITNAGADTLEETYISLWTDADLGGASDDLVACDTTRDLGYAYNAAADDVVYGASPPAVGFTLLQGPLGDGGARLSMTAFNKYIGGADPSRPDQVSSYMRGLDADGQPVIDPVTMQPTRYVVSGDPVTQTGWVDSYPADRLFMVDSGPFTMVPGAVQDIVAAIVLGQGADRLASITALRRNVDDVRAYFAAGEPDSGAAARGRDPGRAVPNPAFLRSGGGTAGGGPGVQFTNLPRSGRVTIRVFDFRGALVRTLVREDDDPIGRTSVDWDLTNASGRSVASGVYAYHVEVAGVGTTRGTVVVLGRLD